VKFLDEFKAPLIKRVFDYDRHAILLQEEYRHGTLITSCALKPLNAR